MIKRKNFTGVTKCRAEEYSLDKLRRIKEILDS